jgi:hypothetical protein
MEPRDYLLKFNFSEFTNKISEASRSYTDFGSVIRSVVDSIAEDATRLQQRATGVTLSISTMSSQISRTLDQSQVHMKSAAGGVESFSRNEQKIVNEATRLVSLLNQIKSMGQTTPGSTQAASRAELAAETAKLAKDLSETAEAQVSDSARVLYYVQGLFQKTINFALDKFKSDLNSAKTSIQGIMSHVPGDIFGGGIISGIIRAMILGYTERDRLRAQYGEVKNVFEASGENLFGEQSRKAMGWFSAFQERAQWFYGVSKEETQAVLRSLVEAGYRSKDVMTTFEKGLGEVGQNIGVASIALDKHFNQQTGTSIKNIIQVTTELGGSLRHAALDYTRLAFAGQRSGMGVEKFVNSVLSGASAMQQYGVDLRDVADVMMNIKKHYEDMGLSSQYAGGQASQVVGGLTQSIANLAPGIKAVLAQRMFPELGALQALQTWEDGFKRAARGNDDAFLKRATLALRSWATERGAGRPEAIQLMMLQGLDNRTAATVYDVGEKLAQSNDISRLSTAEQKNLRNAFQTESERISHLEQTERKLYIAVKDIGLGLIKVLVGIYGLLVVGLKSIPSLIKAAILAISDPLGVTGNRAKAENIISDIGERQDILFGHINSGVDDIIRGTGEFGDALADEFKSAFQPLIDAWKKPGPAEVHPLDHAGSILNRRSGGAGFLGTGALGAGTASGDTPVDVEGEGKSSYAVDRKGAWVPGMDKIAAAAAKAEKRSGLKINKKNLESVIKRPDAPKPTAAGKPIRARLRGAKLKHQQLKRDKDTLL